MIILATTGWIILSALFIYIMGELMRGDLPRFDLVLASAAATPIATERMVSFNSPTHIEGVRFFTTPLVNFNWGDVPVFLTAPDLLALVSSFVLAVRFAAWAIRPVLSRLKLGWKNGNR